MSDIEKEVERLQDFRSRIARMLGQSPSDCDDLLVLGLNSRIILVKRQAARIKELEAFTDAYRRELVRAGDIIEQLEAAFLKSESRRLWDRGESTGESNFDCPEAREKLEKIRSGKDDY